MVSTFAFISTIDRCGDIGFYAVFREMPRDTGRGLHARQIYDRAVKRQPRIQYSNLKAILDKLPSLQVDEDGRGLILGYSSATEEITL